MALSTAIPTIFDTLYDDDHAAVWQYATSIEKCCSYHYKVVNSTWVTLIVV